MLYTIDEGKHIQCPMSLNHPETQGCYCLGPRCAAWRWSSECADSGEQYGYCGMAGIPSLLLDSMLGDLIAVAAGPRTRS